MSEPFGTPSVIRVELVRERVDEIRSVSYDPEVAHGNEDYLFSAVLRGIADGTCVDPAACAAAALEAEQIDFERWRA